MHDYRRQSYNGQTMASLVTFNGRVRKTKDYNGGQFQVQNESGQEVTCCYIFTRGEYGGQKPYLPVRWGDYIKVTGSWTGSQVIINGPTLVYVDRGEGAIRNCLPYNTHINRLKKFVEIFGNDGKQLNELAEVWHDTEDMSLLAPYDEHLRSDMLELLRNWYSRVMLRQLELWGMDKRRDRSIDKCKMSVVEITRHCLKNPTVLMGLTMREAKWMAELHGRILTKEEEAAGYVYRRIQHYLVQFGWTSVPVERLTADIPQLNDSLELLTSEEYGVEFECDCLYLPWVHKVESKVLEEFKKRMTKPEFKIVDGNIVGDEKKKEEGVSGGEVKKKEKTEKIEQVDPQVFKVLTNRMCVISGEPGTGKTTLIGKLFAYLQSQGRKPQVASFTGIAVDRVKRLKQLEGIASTLHMLMSRKQQTPPFTDLIIDESSMLQTELLYKFMIAFPGDYPIYLVGDIGQLPPVGWGALFRQVIESKAIPTLHLTHNYRLKNQDMTTNTLYENFSKMRAGQTDFKTDDTFHLMEGGIENVLGLVKMFKEAELTTTDFVILTPYNIDVSVINRYVQQLYFPDMKSAHVDSAKKIWYVGDTVMMTQNHYLYNIYNGSRGVIKEIKEGKVWVKFNTFENEQKEENGEGKEDLVPFELAHSQKHDDGLQSRKTDSVSDKKVLDTSLIVLAYALTVHKSQGSEWNFVGLYIPSNEEDGDSNSNFLCRPIPYTGITRAKDSVFVVGKRGKLDNCVMKDITIAHDNLARRLKEMMSGK